MENGQEPIIPCIIKGRQGWGDKPTIPNREVYGLTKREYFAGLAIQGLFSNNLNNGNIKDNVSDAIIIADELLKKLNE